MIIPVLSLYQPWAESLMRGDKHFETRPSPPAGNWPWARQGRFAPRRRYPGKPIEPHSTLAIASTARKPVVGPCMDCGATGRLRGCEHCLLACCVWCLHHVHACELVHPDEPCTARPILDSHLLGTVDVVDVVPTDIISIGGADGWRDNHQRLVVFESEYRWGNYKPGRWAWITANRRPLETPIPFSGGQGLSKTIDTEVLAQ